MARRDFEDIFGAHHSRDVERFYDRQEHLWGRDHAEEDTRRALSDATFGRGPLAGKTGDPFKDDPFFNPWAEGGAFNRKTSFHTESSRESSYTPPRPETAAYVLTPTEEGIFTRAFETMSAKEGLKTTGLSRTFNMASHSVDYSPVRLDEFYELAPGEVDLKAKVQPPREWRLNVEAATEYVNQERQARLEMLDDRLGGYVSDKDRELLKTQSLSFDPTRTISASFLKQEMRHDF